MFKFLHKLEAKQKPRADLETSPYVPPGPLNTAVLFLVFNRPDVTAQVFEAIRRARPPRLYVAADGSREGREGEVEKVAKVRAIATNVDWPCEVKTLFREKNLGCKYAVSSAIDWFFENEEMGIILEDDCLPHPSFFWFCQVLLTRFQKDERIMMISGDNFQPAPNSTYSYYFSRYPHVWGWATWRRAWVDYDVHISLWPKIVERGGVKDVFFVKSVQRFWHRTFSSVHAGATNSWANQLMFATLISNRLCILPERNLVSNIGFGIDATHTKGKGSLADIPREPIEFPLRHPPFMVRNTEADARTEEAQFSTRSAPSKVLTKIKRICREM